MARTRGRNRLLALVPAALAVLAAAPAAIGCGAHGYTYAGLASSSKTHGVGARLTATGGARVADGHVAGWVGVGGPGQGPNGADEWIQVGFSGFEGSPNSNLYYEVTRPGAAPKYFEVAHDLPPGTSRRLAVLEVAGNPNAWRVWVDGKPVSKAVYLPRSDGAWRGIATAESWTTNAKVACNAFGYRFDDIRIAQQAGGAWRSLSNALPIRTGANRLLRPSAASFEAVSGPPHRQPVYIAGPIARTRTSAG